MEQTGETGASCVTAWIGREARQSSSEQRIFPSVGGPSARLPATCNLTHLSTSLFF
jgi:hypothetical protein